MSNYKSLSYILFTEHTQALKDLLASQNEIDKRVYSSLFYDTLLLIKARAPKVHSKIENWASTTALEVIKEYVPEFSPICPLSYLKLKEPSKNN